MRVLLLVWSIVFVLHCTAAEDNMEAKFAGETFTESEDNLLADPVDTLNIQARDEPDGDDKIEAVGGGADDNGGGEDENQMRDLAMEIRDLLKQDGEADIPDGQDTDVVESLKRKLEDTAAGDGDDGEGPADDDGTQDTLDTQARAIGCGTRSQTCSSSNRCCSGLTCRYSSSSHYGYRCASRYSPPCRRRSQTCVLGTSSYSYSNYKCCSGLHCKKTRGRYSYRKGYSTVGRCKSNYRG